MAKQGLYANINAKKKAGTSNTKKKSTITPEAYANMQAGFPKKKKKAMYGGKMTMPKKNMPTAAQLNTLKPNTMAAMHIAMSTDTPSPSRAKTLAACLATNLRTVLFLQHITRSPACTRCTCSAASS